jgi:hypothetical protein
MDSDSHLGRARTGFGDSDQSTNGYDNGSQDSCNRSQGSDDAAVNTSASADVSSIQSVRTLDEVKIMYWNIFHNFTLKLTSPEFHAILRTYDIMVFGETDMLPGEEDAADVPQGYTLVSLPRKPRLQTSRRGGGVALLIRDNIKFTKSHLSSPDILVLDLGSMWLVGAYIPPVTSHWQG